MVDKSTYKAEQIKVLEGLEGVRKRFNVIELSNSVKRQGDIHFRRKNSPSMLLACRTNV